MTPTPRKSGIRLPWSQHEESDASQPAETIFAALQKHISSLSLNSVRHGTERRSRRTGRTDGRG